MNLNYILKGIGLVIVLCISIANAEYAEYKGDCKDIYEYLDGKGYDTDMGSCETNEEGKVIDIDIYTFCLKEEDYNILLNYTTIKNIKFNIYSIY